MTALYVTEQAITLVASLTKGKRQMHKFLKYIFKALHEFVFFAVESVKITLRAFFGVLVSAAFIYAPFAIFSHEMALLALIAMLLLVVFFYHFPEFYKLWLEQKQMKKEANNE